MNTPNKSTSPFKDDASKPLLEVLLGAKIDESILGEGALEKALELKLEQERTKQQYYKLENVNRSIELFKMAAETGIHPHDIPKLFSGEYANATLPFSQNKASSTSNVGTALQKTNSQDTFSKQPLSYRFPPAGSNLPPKPVNAITSLPARRTNSPARIGANAVAALNDSVVLKEEDNSPTYSPFINKPSNNYINHNRNLSLPITKSAAANIPSGMTSILSFGKDSNGQTSHALSHSEINSSNVRRAPMVHKKHRRARSASSFGVIDLNVIDNAKQHDLPRLKTQVKSLPMQPSVTNPETHHDYDEKTCSESSSRNESPVRAKSVNPVAKLLNSS